MKTVIYPVEPNVSTIPQNQAQKTVVFSALTVQGEKGEKGDKGDTGPVGLTGLQGPQGIQGETGNGIASIVLTSGNHAPGTLDTYTITFTDGTTTTFQVYNGDNGATNLSKTVTATDVTINSDTGNDVAIGAASETVAGVMVATDKVKLDGIESGATANQTDAYLLNRENHTGQQPISSVAMLQDSLDTLESAIANLATAQAAISDSGAFTLTATPTQLPFTVITPSTDATVMTLDDVSNTFTFLHNASFNWVSNLVLSSATGLPRAITFRLVNTANDAVLVTQSVSLEIQSGRTITLPVTTLLTVGRNGVPVAPLTVRVEAFADATGYTIDSFNSTLVSGSSYDVEVIDRLDELTDVVIALPQSGEVLEFDGTNWVNAQKPKRYLNAILSDASTAITNATSYITPVELPVSGTITNIRARTATGTCSVQFKRNGVALGTAISATTSGVSQTVSQAVVAGCLITVDTSSASGNGLTISVEIN